MPIPTGCCTCLFFTSVTFPHPHFLDSNHPAWWILEMFKWFLKLLVSLIKVLPLRNFSFMKKTILLFFKGVFGRHWNLLSNKILFRRSMILHKVHWLYIIWKTILSHNQVILPNLTLNDFCYTVELNWVWLLVSLFMQSFLGVLHKWFAIEFSQQVILTSQFNPNPGIPHWFCIQVLARANLIELLRSVNYSGIFVQHNSLNYYPW